MMHLLHCRLYIFYIILDVELIGISYRMPITVYMYDEDAGGLISIAEYGQEYGKENPIRILYHGFGHYDALQMPRKKSDRSRL